MRAMDLEAIQAFVLVADLKSFTRAAQAMGTTQSAVSLKIKRLEEGVGRRLLERTPRLVRLSTEGNNFLGPARDLVAAHLSALKSFGTQKRRLIFGISQIILGTELPHLLKHINDSEPELVLELRVASTKDILADFDRGDLDAAIVLGHDNARRTGEAILEEQFGWMASPDFEYRPGDTLRLATQTEPCSVHNTAIAALDKAGVPWTEVFVGTGAGTIGAAVSAGLGISALGRRVAPPGTIDLGPRLGLPELPSPEVMFYSNAADRQTRNFARTVVKAMRATAT